jgi:cytochrome c oxidase assembly factor CtaG
MIDLKAIQIVISAALLAVGAILALYGVFALTFHERRGSTYVTLTGHRLDAYLAGVVSLVIGIAVIVVAVAVMRRRSSCA